MTIRYRNLDEFLARLEASREVIHYDDIHTLREYRDYSDKAVVVSGRGDQPFGTVANLFGTERRTAWALGLERLDELKASLAFLNDLPVSYRAEGLIGRAGAFLGLIQAVGGGSPPRRSAAPVQTHQINSADLDLSILTSTDVQRVDRSGLEARRLTGMQLITANVEANRQSVSLVDVDIVDTTTLNIIGGYMGKHDTASNHQINAALVIGGEPLLTWCAGLPLPPGIDRYLVANWLRNKPTPFVRCLSHQLQVPAEADVVIEGTWELESNVFTASAITHRDNPILPMLLSAERQWMNRAYGYFLYPLIVFMIEGVVDMNYLGDAVIVAAAAKDKAQINRIIFAFWGMEMMLHSRVVIVVAQDIDVQNMEVVNRTVEQHVDWQDDVIVAAGDRLVGIDATGL